MKNKIKLYLCFFIAVLAMLILIRETYALYESNLNGNANLNIANWIIKLNNETITNGTVEELVLDNFNYSIGSGIEENYIAPGNSAYCDIVIDPNGTEVSVRYDLTFNTDELEYADNIGFEVGFVSGSTAVKTGPNTYSGVINLSDIESANNISLRVSIVWDDDNEHNEEDTQLGIVVNNTISVPVTVNVKQYLGETLVEYVPPEETE